MTETDLKCAFSAPQVSGAFGCSLGRQVVRRGGAEIACGSEHAQRRCSQLFECLKASALDHMDMEDDLLSLPHSVLLKVQYGGLLGLQRQMSETGEVVEDVNALVERLLQKYGDVKTVPCEAVAPDIAEYKTARRRQR